MSACVGSTGLKKKQNLSLSVLEPAFLIIQLVACSNDRVLPEQEARIELHEEIEFSLRILSLFLKICTK